MNGLVEYDKIHEEALAIELNADNANAVPDMPYKKTDQWVGMAMRRVIKMAAEQGMDRIAWVTGEQSAERFDLSKTVDYITADTVDARGGGTNVYILNKDNSDVGIFVNKEGVVTDSKNEEFIGKTLDLIIGKDLAEKILSEEGANRKYSGNDLKVGGEGMKTFYNSILPKNAVKEARRFGFKGKRADVVDFTPPKADPIKPRKATVKHEKFTPLELFKKSEPNEVTVEYNNPNAENKYSVISVGDNVISMINELYGNQGIKTEKHKTKEDAIAYVEKQITQNEKGFERYYGVDEDGNTIENGGGETKEQAQRKSDRILNPPIEDESSERGEASKQLSIPITPEMRMNLNGAIPLFQGAQGAMVAEDGNYVIYALTDPNVSTPLHEMAHVFEKYLSEDEVKKVLAWTGHRKWDTKTSERFARGFERFLKNGKAPTPQLQKIFQKFKDWLTDIYNGIKNADINIPLNDDMIEIYSNMLGKDEVDSFVAEVEQRIADEKIADEKFAEEEAAKMDAREDEQRAEEKQRKKEGHQFKDIENQWQPISEAEYDEAHGDGAYKENKALLKGLVTKEGSETPIDVRQNEENKNEVEYFDPAEIHKYIDEVVAERNIGKEETYTVPKQKKVRKTTPKKKKAGDKVSTGDFLRGLADKVRNEEEMDDGIAFGGIIPFKQVFEAAAEAVAKTLDATAYVSDIVDALVEEIKNNKAFMDGFSRAQKKALDVQAMVLDSMGLSKEAYLEDKVAATEKKGKEAAKQAAKEAKKEGREEGKNKLLTGRYKATAQLEKVQSESYEAADEALSGIKNELVPEEHKGVFQKEKRTVVETLERGKALLDSKSINPQVFIKQLLTEPRPITADETAAMVYYKAQLDGRSDSIHEAIDKARLDGDQEAMSTAQLAIAEVNTEIALYHQFQEASGYEQGLSLRMRQLLMTREYELGNQVQKYKDLTGRNHVPKDVMAKFEAYDEQIRELEKKIKKHEAKEKDLSQKLEILSEGGTSTDTSIKEASAQLAKKVRKLKFVQTMNDLSKLQADPTGLFKFAWDGALEVLATTIQQGGAVADAVEKAVIAIKDSEWYKGLSEEGKKKAEPIARKGILKEVYGVSNIKPPSLREDGSLIIPDSFIKDLILQGFDTIETATTEATRLIKEELGEEVSEREVRDAISDYGKTSQLSKEPLNEALRKMKRLGKLASALEDVMQKKRPLRSGKQRDKITDKERAIRREINDLLKDIPQTSEEVESEWKSALEAIKQRLNNRIKDLITQINEGKKSPQKRSVQLDADAMALQEQVDELNAMVRSIEGKPELTFEQRVRIIEAALEKSIKEYERRIAEKDYAPINTKPITTAKIEALRTKRAKLKEEFDRAVYGSPEGQAKYDETAVKRIAKQIDKITAQINGSLALESVKEGKREYSAHVKAHQEALNNLKEQLKETDHYKEHAEKKKLEFIKKNAIRQTEKYKERLRNKDFAVKKPVQHKLDEEARKLKAEQLKWKHKFDTEMEKHKLDERPQLEKITEGVVDILGIPRAMMASMDVSATFRQGGMFSVRHPKIAARASAEMAKQGVSEERFENWMNELMVSDLYPEMKQAGLYIAEPNASLMAKEESFISNTAEKIPIWGTHLIKGSNRMYSAYLNILRVEVFKQFHESIKDRGFTDEQMQENLKDMADFINNATGRGSLGKFRAEEPFLNMTMFAPRFVLSRLNIIMNLLSGYSVYSRPVQIEALRSIGTYVGVIGAISMLAWLAGADDEELDPRSSDFGKIRIGPLRIDPWAGYTQMIVFLTRMITGQTKNLKDGKVVNLNERGRYGRKQVDVLETFFRGKSSPAVGTLVDYWSRDKGKTKEWEFRGYTFENTLYFKNLMGQESTIPEKILNLTTPIYMLDAKAVIEDEDNGGVGMAMLTVLPDIIGWGTQYHFESELDANDLQNQKDKAEAVEKEASLQTALEKIAAKNKKAGSPTYSNYIKETNVPYAVSRERAKLLNKYNATSHDRFSERPKLAKAYNVAVLKKTQAKNMALLKSFVSNEGEGKTIRGKDKLASAYVDNIIRKQKLDFKLTDDHEQILRGALMYMDTKSDINKYIKDVNKYIAEFEKDFKTW